MNNHQIEPLVATEQKQNSLLLDLTSQELKILCAAILDPKYKFDINFSAFRTESFIITNACIEYLSDKSKTSVIEFYETLQYNSFSKIYLEFQKERGSNQGMGHCERIVDYMVFGRSGLWNSTDRSLVIGGIKDPSKRGSDWHGHLLEVIGATLMPMLKTIERYGGAGKIKTTEPEIIGSVKNLLEGAQRMGRLLNEKEERILFASIRTAEVFFSPQTKTQ